MARLLFRLRNVPEEEAEEVRDLLRAHDIAFYETSAGNWGISMPGLWLHSEQDYEYARAVLDNYQIERSQRMRRAYQLAQDNGQAETQWQRLCREPLKTIGYLAIVTAILYLSISVFYKL